MISRTKFEIDENTLITLFESAGITSVEEVRELGAGCILYGLFERVNSYQLFHYGKARGDPVG